ncbi:MAG: PSD1 and planctomycete cytochrome C domain-containing protein [Planctomycetota bacterium]
MSAQPHPSLSVIALSSALALLSAHPSAAASDEADFFESHIRPLLVEHCISCHGPGRQEGGLRLDSKASLLQGGNSGPEGVPGNPEDSRMLHAIEYSSDLQMPPTGQLPKTSADALRHWIQIGLPWPQTVAPLQPPATRNHWAFQPLTHPEVPELPDLPAATPVDAFIHRRLQQAGLAMSPEADRRTLIRRACYSLTGLPPTPAEVEQFVADPDPQALQKLIDRLLESPAHAEHWARHWLDIARYSDTKGYVYAREERFWVHAWNYRNWVIQAFARDLPYNRFLLLQLAADQVPDSSPEDLAAMGFLTIGRRFLGVRRDIIDDQIDVVCRGTMALTVGCARCHDHKYDPIPTADYYSLYGVFDSSREALLPLPANTVAHTEFLTSWQQQATQANSILQARRETTSARIRSRISDYLAAQLDLARYPEAGFDQILSANDLLPSFVHRWRDTLQQAAISHDPVFTAWHAFQKIPAADFPAAAPAVHSQLLQLPPQQLNPRVRTAFLTPPASFTQVIQRYSQVFLQADQEWQTLLHTANASKQPLPLQHPDADAEPLRQLLYDPSGPCFVPDEPVVSTEYDFDSGTCNELWKQQVELERLILKHPSQPPFSVVLKDRAVPAQPQIFQRGDPARRGDPVPRQFLALLSNPQRQPFQHGSGRLELAQAIIDPANPLTARVIVNRVWARHFGTGLAANTGDFGLRSEAPSHPELLDWLTSWFIQEGYSLRKLHRLLLNTAVWRQQSTGPSDSTALQIATTRDPANRLLWRMPSRRLSFEELRDSLLAASGQLDLTPGRRPQDLFTTPFPKCRTIYGLVDRQFLPGTLRLFDFANPDLHIPQRSETTVPQQALFLMNHPFVLLQARSLAERAATHATDPEAQIKHLFQLTLQRTPMPAEHAAALELLNQPSPPTEPPPITAADWSYGFGRLDESAGKVVNFQPLPHWTGTAWQGGPAFPDSALGWVQLTATGGHPGNDLAHACIRRWTAPRNLTITIQSTLVHEPEPGDGIRAFIVSSRAGVLASTVIHKQKQQPAVTSISVQAQETIDFLVDVREQLNSDQFLWSVKISSDKTPADPVPATLTPPTNVPADPATWDSASDFPKAPNSELTPLQQLAHVLLCSNEFLFVD